MWTSEPIKSIEERCYHRIEPIYRVGLSHPPVESYINKHTKYPFIFVSYLYEFKTEPRACVSARP